MINRGSRALDAEIIKCFTMAESFVIQDDPKGAEAYRCLLDAWRPLEAMESQVLGIFEILQQRLTLEDGADWHLTADHTEGVAEIHRLYSAIDAVAMSFVSDILGEDWIIRQERAGRAWLPLAVVRNEFRVRSSLPGPTFLHLPRADLFRSRLWPVIGHEVAHVLVQELWTAKHKSRSLGIAMPPLAIRLEQHQASLREVICRCVLEPIARVPGLSWVPDAYQDCVHQWIAEFICDAIGAYVAGPAFALAMLSFLGPDIPPSRTWSDENVGQDARVQVRLALRPAHPSSWIRQTVLAHIMIAMGFGDWLKDCGYEEIVGRSRSLCVPGKDREWNTCMDGWGAAAPQLAELSLAATKDLLPRTTRQFDLAMYAEAHSVEAALNRARDPQRLVPGLTSDGIPRIVLNAGWINRLSIAQRVRNCDAELGAGRNSIHSLATDPRRPLGMMFGGIVMALNEYSNERWKEIQRAAAQTG